MPVPGFPDSYELLKYHGATDIRGGSQSTFEFACHKDDYDVVRAIFLRALDANDLTLQCASVSRDYLAVKDADEIIYKCTANFIPSWRLESLIPDQPFRWRLRGGSQSFTLRSELWKWASNEPINNDTVKPLMSIATCDVVLYGTRSVYDPSTYAAYVDTVNADTILGVPPGYMMFGQGPTASPRQLEDGTMTWDVEIPVTVRWVATWNEFFNEDTGYFEAIKDADGNPMFASINYAPLLEVP